jgi:AcrR family transcriptional regulator
MIQTEAFRLFGDKGYTETTVEEIADAAAISPSTFFRYFPSKEDVVLWDEYDALSLDLLAARPADEPAAETMRLVIRESLAGLYRRDPGQLLARVRLEFTVPELRARAFNEQAHGIEQLLPLLRRKKGAVDELHVRVTASALLGAVMIALDRWQAADGTTDLLALVDEATDALADCTHELQTSRRRSRKSV